VTTLKTVAETAQALGKEVTESVQELGRTAGRRFDEARSGTGSTLHAAASSVRKGSATIDNLVAGTADRLDATASYVEGFEAKNVFARLRNFSRGHLTATVMVAAAAGFLAGSALCRAARPNGRVPEIT
jgi:ElaB/YqjD/DUF883 family membrane-anchored ribosome-binding protein